MEAERPGRRWLFVVGAGAVGVVVVVVALLHSTSPRHDDCAVAADVMSTWRSMTASVDQMLGGDQLLAAAFTESATADQLRIRAGGIASPHIRADVIGLADALETIAHSHRTALASRQDPSAAAGQQEYINGSRHAVAAAAALRMACPSIPANSTAPLAAP